MLEIRQQWLAHQIVDQAIEVHQMTQLFLFDSPVWVDPNGVFKILKNSQSVQPERCVDRVPALVDLRTGGQILWAEKPEQLDDHVYRQFVDGG